MKPGSTAKRSVESGLGHFGRRGAVLAILALVTLGMMYRDGIRELFHLWSIKEEYSHAYLLPFISAFLFWQKKNELLSRPWIGAWGAVGLVILGILTYFLGTLSTIYAIIHYSLFITMAGLVLSYAGWSNLPYLWAGLALLLFTVPFPQFIYQVLSTKLQLLSSELGVAVIRMMGISVFLEGNVIDLGNFKLQVVEACNGLRYLFPLASFGFLCGYLYRGPVWHKVLVFLSTIPITVLMNSFRIGVIGITVDRWGASMAEGILHDFEGWAIFMACLGVLFMEMALLARIQKPPSSFTESFFVEIPGPAPSSPIRNWGRAPKPFVTSVVLLVVAAAMSLMLEKRTETIPVRADFADFPLEFADWKGQRQQLEQVYIAALKFTDYVMANYVEKSHQSAVNFYVAYYESQRAGESAHSPRSCIPGGGWKIEEHDVKRLTGVLNGDGDLMVNRIQIAMGDNRQLVYYWFQQRGRNITNEYLVKWYLLWDSLVKNRSDGALVRVVTTIPVGAPWSDGDVVLERFIRDVAGELKSFVPD